MVSDVFGVALKENEHVLVCLGCLAPLKVVACSQAAAPDLLNENEAVYKGSAEGFEYAYKVACKVVVALCKVVAHVSDDEDCKAVVVQAFPPPLKPSAKICMKAL